MVRKFKAAGALLWITLVWVIVVYHRGVALPPPQLTVASQLTHRDSARFIGKKELGINQLILSGTSFSRGRLAGELTRGLLHKQESLLTERLQEIFPNSLFRRLLEIAALRWFWGIDKFFEADHLAEMYGVSRSASPEFDYLIDGYTRQICYHCLHEVGQMMVDFHQDELLGGACTVVAVPQKAGWLIGRNFDFEGGNVFDNEKVVKWVFPDSGYPFVSVIWAGMVGTVTGINDQGLYISINAAGSLDWRRYGTPSTLLALKALQFASRAEQAVRIIRDSRIFITDIFVVADSRGGQAFRIEKSPQHTEVFELQSPSVITNHLLGERWRNDSINLMRRDQLTSLARQQRGEELLRQWPSNAAPSADRVLAILRDKRAVGGELLHLGNRNAIDALIATHSVVVDGEQQILYVSQGPALSGPYLGFGLRQSFAKRAPIIIRELEHDSAVPQGQYDRVKQALQLIKQARLYLQHHDCDAAKSLLLEAGRLYDGSYEWAMASGDYYACAKDNTQAVHYWRLALERHPAYARDREYLLRRTDGLRP